MIIYFSGTGNSRYCAKFLADKLNDELLSAADYIRNQIAADLISGTPWVFVAPTYAWQLPRIFDNFIRTGNFDGHKDAWFVMTCGSDIGSAGEKIKELCEKVGLRYKGVLEVIMPENYIAMFNAPEKEEAKRIVAAAQPVLEAGAERIRQGLAFQEKKLTAGDRRKTGPINAAFYTLYVKAKAFCATDACIGCGKCEGACVLNNIMLKDGKPVWGDTCTHCMACICGCPTEAIEYGKKSKGKLRYWCCEYTGEK